MYSPENVPFPESIGDIIDTETYDPQYGWYDLGSTKGGVILSVADAEKDYKTIEQEGSGTIVSEYSRDVNITTALSDANLNIINFLIEGEVKDVFGQTWHGTELSTEEEVQIDTTAYYGVGIYGTNTYGISVESIIVPASTSYMNRIALLSMNDGLIRAVVLRRAYTMLAETTFAFNKTGPQQSLAVKFHCYPDSSITDLRKSYFVIREQVAS